MFDDSIFEAVKAIRPSARNELEITDAIQWLVDHGKTVHPHLVSGWWKDTGKIEDMLEANRIILDTFTARGLETVDGSCRVEGKVVIEPGAKLDALHGPRPGGHRAGRRDPRRLRGTLHGGRRRAASSTAARSRTRSCSRARGWSGSRCASRIR